MTIYITGGHLTPALAVIDELSKKYPDETLLFFGREFSQTENRQPSHERTEIEARHIPFIPIQAAKFHRTNWTANLSELLRFPLSLLEVARQYRRLKPDRVLSFGGYLAFPVCLLGKLFGAKVITHEQTKVAGLANQVIGWFADVVALAHPESLSYFPAGKSVVTGNPIREAMFREYKTVPSWCSPSIKTKPLLYITGGSQGSHIINQTIATLLPKLTRDFYVVHQCGPSAGGRTLKDLLAEREKLPTELQDNYTVREWIDGKEVSFLIRTATCVICRAGANTVQELTLAGTPAIFIPLAFAYNDEQYKNAQALVDADASILIPQKDLYPETLLSALQRFMMQYDTIKANMRKQSQQMIKNGTTRLIKLLLSSAT